MPESNEGRDFSVGLVWQSSNWNPARSIPFEQLARLTTLGCRLHFVQQDATTKGWDVFDTARAIGPLDLMISVDTMSAHLAGALGTPVWILLPKRADWRWMEDRESSPWYPTATLFRQQIEGDWSGVIERVMDALREVLSRSHHSDSIRPE